MTFQREDLAVRLSEERGRLGYTQADMARKLDMSREGLRLYENGQRAIGAEFLAGAASIGMDVQYVLTGIRSANLKEVEKVNEAPLAPVIHINSAGNVIGKVEPGATVHQINTQRHVTRTVAEVKPGSEHISEEQAVKLTELVATVVEAEAAIKAKPATHRAVWAALNAHCKVTRYRLIPASQFESARKYLQQWIGRLNSQSSAPVVNSDMWRKRKYSYIKINCKGSEQALNEYLRKNFKVDSLTELSNDELEQTYRHVVSRKRK